MASYRMVRMELDKLCILLQRPVPDRELDVIAREWAVSFAELEDALLGKALFEHRQKSSFFPTEAELRKILAAMPQERPLPPALPERTQSREERKAFKERAALAKRALLGDALARNYFFSRGDEREELSRLLCEEDARQRAGPGENTLLGPCGSGENIPL